MHRIVHLDLKGAPLKIAYLEKVILYIKANGATGILLEWEDTFPYSSVLTEIGSLNNSGGDNMYSLEEVQHIMQFTRVNGLEPIQLIQTIGHMEFVLKHPAFRDLREVDRTPSSLCPSKPKSQVLVREMINQALEVQLDAKFLHIGADEVWHLAVCADCQTRAMGHTKASVFLDHIKNLVLFIKEQRPDIVVLMWDDMLRDMDTRILKEYAIGELVVPVFWRYNSKEYFSIQAGLLEKYALVFPKLWIGTAFKGANGSCQILSPTKRYVSNHEAWVAHMKAFSDRIKFSGVILTGWSRYDHYATLCELLPVSLPCLVSCLRVLIEAEGMAMCSKTNYEDLPLGNWPGEELARWIQSFVVLKSRCEGLLNCDQINTWLNPWQISRKFTIPAHVDMITSTAHDFHLELTVLRDNISTRLLEITGERSTEEWLKTNLEPWFEKIGKLLEISTERSAADASVRPLV